MNTTWKEVRDVRKFYAANGCDAFSWFDEAGRKTILDMAFRAPSLEVIRFLVEDQHVDLRECLERSLSRRAAAVASYLLSLPYAGDAPMVLRFVTWCDVVSSDGTMDDPLRILLNTPHNILSDFSPDSLVALFSQCTSSQTLHILVERYGYAPLTSEYVVSILLKELVVSARQLVEEFHVSPHAGLLFVAARYGDMDTLVYLLENHRVALRREADGASVLDVARQYYQGHCFDYLEERLRGACIVCGRFAANDILYPCRHACVCETCDVATCPLGGCGAVVIIRRRKKIIKNV